MEQSVRADERRLRGPEMEGAIARWYTRLRGTPPQLEAYQRRALELTRDLPDGAAVLEVAPGPGFLAVAMARSGRLRVSALDISRTFVGIVAEHAREAGVVIDVRQGDAASMPFEPESFDLIICESAFKNFRRPTEALNQMHRVLRPGGCALILDMNSRASKADIAAEVETMKLNPFNAFSTRRTLSVLRRRAYTPETFGELAAASAFGRCAISARGIGMEVRLDKEFPGGQ
jgi:ubiquinone/menaquinone biosynthesis C-methylase UbiE